MLRSQNSERPTTKDTIYIPEPKSLKATIIRHGTIIRLLLVSPSSCEYVQFGSTHSLKNNSLGGVQRARQHQSNRILLFTAESSILSRNGLPATLTRRKQHAACSSFNTLPMSTKSACPCKTTSRTSRAGRKTSRAVL